MPVPPEERRARAALTLFPLDKARDAAVHTGGAEAVWASLSAGSDLDPDGLIATHTARGWRLLCPGDDEWPPTLTPAQGMPIGLWARGDGHLADLMARSVAVAGTRRPSPHRAHLTGQLAQGLVTATPTVTVIATVGVGVGVQALTAAVTHGPTVAVLTATSLSRHPELLEMVTVHGVQLSDAPPLGPSVRDAPSRRTALRTALLAALSSALLVVETETSGPLMETARAARRRGRTVLAVPPETDAEPVGGCHQLLRGAVAVPVMTVADITGHLPAV
ncbi:hypothetical protein ACG83_40940 [Frankia sp. R43]|uniref:DNA-processing protein DprA n=1 Tax=Frankia sp. R43 TaxID=269536 RepID=UPI0006CA45F2|nr:DNA-processing protein DprA [Frankia sp. R43]KPM50308.1 hypothetical protein ACG83_40940 [Frankia sp. R43]